MVGGGALLLPGNTRYLKHSWAPGVSAAIPAACKAGGRCGQQPCTSGALQWNALPTAPQQNVGGKHHTEVMALHPLCSGIKEHEVHGKTPQATHEVNRLISGS